MKAAILVRQNAPLVVADVELPSLGLGQVLVRVDCSAICGKQIDEITGKRGEDPFLPHLLGHEAAGVVAGVGPEVRKVKPGDRVVLHWMKGSGIESATPRFTWNGSAVNAGWVTTFSEYTVASENRLTPVDADVGADLLALLGCSVTTGLGIVFNDADLKPGQSIAVFGVGGVGLNVVQGARLVNAYPIVAIDLHDHKLERAHAFGATHAISARRPDLEQVLMEVSGGRGFDATVDAVGDHAIIEMAYRLTSNTGKIILAGVPDHRGRVTIDSFPLHFGRTILGSHGGSTQPDVDIPRYLGLYLRGQLKLSELITHRYHLDEINMAIEVVRRGEAGRCVISMV